MLPTTQRARRTSMGVEALVWKHYLQVRTERVETPRGGKHALLSASSSSTRARKRVRTRCEANAEEASATLVQIRAYWSQLSASERLQILFVDDPELVKQLYKLNLSLLCVGLMQRHLKAPNRSAMAATTAETATASASTVPTAALNHTAASAEDVGTSENKSMDIDQAPAARVTPVEPPRKDKEETLTDSAAEKTYELLEAMEFMDIGTGILTVKSELVEEAGRIFTLVGAVLPAFLTTIHLLTEAQFQQLFVKECEVVATWDDYEVLIGMLVEQLILRSYVVHLEKTATQQMEQLLLEVSLEDGLKAGTQHSETGKKKKKKKKKMKVKKKKGASTEAVETASVEHYDKAAKATTMREAATESESEPDHEMDDDPIASSNVDVNMPGIPEPVTSPDHSFSRPSSALNPHARVYQPPVVSEPSESIDYTCKAAVSSPTSPSSGKRKRGDYVITVQWEDIVVNDAAYDVDDQAVADPFVASHNKSYGRRPWSKSRRRQEEESELTQHLENMYASGSFHLGWDFIHQREIRAQSTEPWSDETLWKTAPRDVVRYYLPPTAAASTATDKANPAQFSESFSSSMSTHPHRRQRGSQGLTLSTSSVESDVTWPPSSRYYFAPRSSSQRYPRYRTSSSQGSQAPISFWKRSVSSPSPNDVVATAEFPSSLRSGDLSSPS